jgi:uncharacterized membrane protein
MNFRLTRAKIVVSILVGLFFLFGTHLAVYGARLPWSIHNFIAGLVGFLAVYVIWSFNQKNNSY